MAERREGLPKSLQDFIKKYPQVWEAHEKLGVACKKAGPLEEKYVQLIKLALSGLQMHETAFKTHVRGALRAGAKPAEIEQTILQLLPTAGINSMMIAMNWAKDVIGVSPTV